MIAISLLNKINNDFKLKVDELCVPKLYEFNNLTSNIFDSLFVNTKMASPITLDYDYSYYTKGYYKQKEIYLKNIQLSKDLVVDYTKSSYPEVLKLIISEPDEMLKKIYLSNWFNKFQGDKYPSEEDILKINNLVNEENKSIVRKFYEKYYVYELI